MIMMIIWGMPDPGKCCSLFLAVHCSKFSASQTTINYELDWNMIWIWISEMELQSNYHSSMAPQVTLLLKSSWPDKLWHYPRFVPELYENFFKICFCRRNKRTWEFFLKLIIGEWHTEIGCNNIVWRKCTLVYIHWLISFFTWKSNTEMSFQLAFIFSVLSFYHIFPLFRFKRNYFCFKKLLIWRT